MPGANPKPASVFSWATSPPPGAIVQPASSLIQSGYAYQSRPAADNWNWMFNLLGQWTAYLDTLEYGGSGPITVGTPDAVTGVRPIGFSPNLTAHGLAAGATPTAAWDAPNNWFDFGIPAGAPGANGANGADGKTIWSGTTNPSRTFSGPPLYQYTTVPAGAKNGDFYLNTSTNTNTLFGPFNDANGENAWGTGVSLIGPAGQNGTDFTAKKVKLTVPLAAGGGSNVYQGYAETLGDTGWAGKTIIASIYEIDSDQLGYGGGSFSLATHIDAVGHLVVYVRFHLENGTIYPSSVEVHAMGL